MSIDLNLINFQRAQDQIRQELKKFSSGKYVTVGIHEDAAQPDGTTMTMAQLGATLNFGATINHPGGTSYGYRTRKEAESSGKVRFLRSGKGYMEMGRTKAHTITIPARPWLVPGVEAATPEILSTIADGITDQLPLDQILDQVGAVAAAGVQQFMTELREPPNAKSTIAKKKSDNPLIDTGALRASVTYAIQTGGKPPEGL